jgi:hypothetical protein
MAYKFSLGTYRHSGSLVSEDSLTVDSGGLTISAGTTSVQGVQATSLSASTTLQIGGQSTLAQTLTISGGGAVITGTVDTTAALTAGGAITTTSGDIKTQSGFLSASSGVQTAGGVLAAGNISGGTVTGSNGIRANGGNIIAQSGDIIAQAGQLSASVSISTGGGITSAQGYTATTGDIKANGGAVTGSLGILAGTAGGTSVVLGGDGRISGSAGLLVGGNATIGNKLSVSGQVSVTGSATFNNTVSGSSSLTFASVVTDNVDINGGSIDGAAIGSAAQSTVKATTLSGSSTLEVGSSATIANGLTVTAGGLTVSAGDSSVQKLTVNGDLVVLGNTFSASVGTLLIEDAAIVIGDGTTSFASDYGVLFGSGSNQWASLVTAQANIDGVAGNENILSSSLPIKASAFAGTFYGTMAATVTSFGDADATLAIGVNYGNASLTTGRTLTLPASPTVGEAVRVKAPSNCSSTNTLTIARAGSQTIDGETQVVLESPFAGVELVYVATDTWRIF